MLPSTGYFKGITCPFFESGLCERPYCHFRHVRRDPDIVSCEKVDNADMLEQLVSEAVKKVLLQSDGNSVDIASKSRNIITKVVEELQPATSILNEKLIIKATYNPTPIAELNKINLNSTDTVEHTKQTNNHENRKHIPVPYTPLRPTRSQLTRTPVKLDSSSSHSVQQTCTTKTVDEQGKYTPSAVESESSIKYLPGSVAESLTPYSPMGQSGIGKSNASYVPSNLSNNNCVIPVSGYSPTGQSISGASYKPGVVQVLSSVNYCPSQFNLNESERKSSNHMPKFNYKPTPLNKPPSPTFSSDEDSEPSAKKAKMCKAQDLDDLDVEFEMLGEILEDENSSLRKTNKNSSNVLPKTRVLDKSIIPNEIVSDDLKIKQNTSVGDVAVCASDDIVVVDSESSDLHKDKSSQRKDSAKSSSKYSSKTSRDASPKRDHKHSSKNKEETNKEKHKQDIKNKDQCSRDKDSSRRDKTSSFSSHKSSSKEERVSDKEKGSLTCEKNSSNDRNHSAKKSNKDLDKKRDSHHHKKIEKPKSSEKNFKSKELHKDLNCKSKSKSSCSSHRDSKSKSSDKHDTKDKIYSNKFDKRGEKSHKSLHSSSRHSLKNKNEYSSDKVASNKSKDFKCQNIKEINMFSKNENSDDEPVENEIIELVSDSDEENITEECMKIFHEYVPAIKSSIPNPECSKEENSENSTLSGKKRVAHSTSVTIYRTPSTALPNHKTKAIEMVTKRHAQIKQFHNERLIKTSSSDSIPSQPIESNNSQASGSKVRIAHVPYASTLINAKKSLILPEPPKTTPCQTITKGTSRIAHLPNDKFSDRPTPLEPLASKVPINIRSKYLNLMIDDCLKIYLTIEDAYERALQEELSTNKKCTTVTIYKNSALMTISKLRREIKEASGKKIGSDNKTISHNKIMLGKKGETVSWSIENKYKKDSCDISNELKGNNLYNNVFKWILTEVQLEENGFPRPHPDRKEKGYAKIYTKNTRQKPQKGFTRCCSRCKKEYLVDKKGFAVNKEECIYHPNNKYRFRGEVKYQCCGQDASSDGCLSASCHVYEYVDSENLRGFVTTLPKEDDSFCHGVYALDCEMCYTTHGLDLTRVTVIDSNFKVVYESLVKPLHPIIDYNTNFSGITAEQMKDVTTSLLEVQATLLHMFSNKTILVGHSLESDFKALKLIHDTVVDTSVLFPHKMGPPYKRALRNLSSEYLKKIIQNSVDGHDSAEDALVCMELLKWKVREEFKLK